MHCFHAMPVHAPHAAHAAVLLQPPPPLPNPPTRTHIGPTMCADYDGLAVAWGVGNKKRTLEECARACKEHVPPGVGERAGRAVL